MQGSTEHNIYLYYTYIYTYTYSRHIGATKCFRIDKGTCNDMVHVHIILYIIYYIYDREGTPRRTDDRAPLQCSSH